MRWILTLLFQKGDSTLSSRKQILIEQRNELISRIEDMQTALNKLSKKIDWYDENMKNYEDKNLKKEER